MHTSKCVRRIGVVRARHFFIEFFPTMVVLQRHLATNNITTTKSIGTRNILCRTNTNKNEEFIYFYCFLKKNGKLKKKIYQS